MPLLKRREFKPLKPPDDLDPDEEVFVCRLTNEIFRDYDDFFKRTILCNSLVWSCSLTTRPGLTYQEALESEDRARKLLASFPVYLETPILFLVTLTRRGRLADMCDDVFVFARDRYFVGEIVDVTYRNKRETCRVERVIPPGDYGKQLEEPQTSTSNESDEVMIVGENGEVTEVVIIQEEKPVPKTPKTWKPKTLHPSGYKYEVLSLQGSGKYKVGAEKVSRKKGLYTRDKNKLYLKQNCRLSDMLWNVKPDVAKKFNLQDKKFTDFFAGPLPNFASTPAKRNKADNRKDIDDEDDLPLTEVKKKEAKLKKKDKAKEKVKKEKEKSSAQSEKPKKPKLTPEEKEAIKQKLREMKLQEKQKRMEEKMKERDALRQKKMEEKLAKREESKRAMEEDKEKRKKERELMRIEKQKMEEYLKEWNKPREDLECDDLKDLPKPNPVRCRIPQDLFGDALMLMEFLYAFGDQLGVQEEFPEGITLETIEEALFSRQVDGALFDLLKLLLSSIFHLQDEEEEDEKVDLKEHTMDTSTGDLADILNEDDPTYAALSKAASSALVWSQIHQGTPLRNLPLESTTISEVLRLHLLASGAETSVMDARWRYQQRGAYTFHDDPGLELRLKEPSILKSLTTGNVFDLKPDSRMKIINALSNQILSYVTMRDIIEESWDQWQVTKKEWREICRLEKLREKEESAIKYKRKMEERARMHRALEEQRRAEEAKKAAELKQVETGTSEQKADESTGSGTTAPVNGEVREENPAKTDAKSSKSTDMVLEDLGEELSPAEKEKRRIKEEKESAAKKQEFLNQKEEYEKNLTEFSTRYSVVPVGLDRIFRRYWVFQSVPGLFVEFDKELMDGIDSLMLPKETKDDPPENGETQEPGVKEDGNSSGMSEDSNKENKEIVEGEVEVVKRETTEVAALRENGEVVKLGSTENQISKSIPGIKNGKTEVPMEVSETESKEVGKEGVNNGGGVLLHKDTLDKPKEELVNGVVDHSETNVIDERKTVPQSPVRGLKEEGSPVTEEDSSNQDIVPWAYYSSIEELDALLESLNSRGFREGALKTHLSHSREKIVSNFEAFPGNFLQGVQVDGDGTPWSSQKLPSTPRQVVIKMTSGKKGLVSNQANGDETLELLLREAILDLEDRVWQGGLGVIKVDDRVSWIQAIEQGSYVRQCSQISWGPLWARSLMDDSDFLDMSISEPSLLEDSKKVSSLKKDRVSELKKSETPSGSPSATRCSTPTITDNVVRDMACALLQISQGLHEKYLIKPLGIHEEVKRPGPRSRKVEEKKEEEEEKDNEDEEEKKPKKTCRECWEESLMASSSLSQVFLHLSTLEQSILWSKSILNARCRICRRKGDAEAMLLCDYCDRGHHMYCLKPPLKNVPKGDWYCKDCTPKAVKRTPRKTRRGTFDEEAEEKVEEEEEEEDEDEEEEEEDSDSEDSSEEEDEEEDEEEEEEDEEEEEEEGEEEEEVEEEEVEEEEEEVKIEVKKGRTRGGRAKVEVKKGKGTTTTTTATQKTEAVLRRGRGAARKVVEEEIEEEVEEEAEEDSSEDELLNDSMILTSRDAYYTCCKCRHGGQLLTCTGCEGAVHWGCLEPGQLKKGETWCCETCQSGNFEKGEMEDTSQHGEVCGECGHGGKLLFCSTCPTALHLGCCDPPFVRMPRKEWQCNVCKGIVQDEDTPEKPAKQSRGGRGKTSQRATKETPESSQRPSRHSRRRTFDTDSEVHTVQVDDEITLNISDDGSKLKKALRESRQEGQRSSRGQKRTRSVEEDADTEEEEDAAAQIQTKKRSLTVVLTRQDKELRKLASVDGFAKSPPTSRRRSSTTGRGSADMQQIAVCEQLLKELVRHPDAGPFMVPVSKKIVPDYYRIIKRPMDFSTMQSKLNTIQYKTPVEFVADLRLIFTNCQQYNRYQSYEAKKGRKMWAFLEQRIEELGIEVEGPSGKRKVTSSPIKSDGETGEPKRARRKKVITDL